MFKGLIKGLNVPLKAIFKSIIWLETNIDAPARFINCNNLVLVYKATERNAMPFDTTPCHTNEVCAPFV